jgi:sec-independent protein translocase protein TatC
MVTESEEPRTQLEEEEEEGGPVKPFLDHLEDLRWVLIKSFSVVGIAILVCLLAGPVVVKVLLRPLEHSTLSYPKNEQVVSFFWGTNQLGPVFTQPRDAKGFPFGTNKFVALQLVPVTIGDQRVLGLQPDPERSIVMEKKLPVTIENFGPASAFILAFKVAIYAGIAIASPFIFYFVGSFVFPALKLTERRYVYQGLGFGFGLFALGVAFCYFVLMPLALIASVEYSQWLGFNVTRWRAEEYISFVCKFMLGMGIGFELPVVVLTLVKIGVVNYAILSKARPYVVVMNFVLGAVLTTPEVITQVAMAIPLQILYEISVWITWYWERRDRKKLAAEEAASAAAS